MINVSKRLVIIGSKIVPPEKTASTKVLRQEDAWEAGDAGRRPAHWEHTEQGSNKLEWWTEGQTKVRSCSSTKNFKLYSQFHNNPLEGFE